MPQQGLIVRVLIASPADVTEERLAVPDEIAAWNATFSLSRSVIIEPVKWEIHAVPGLEGRPQGMLNEQLAGQCDFLIGVFWTRIGTRIGAAESGTVEEIEEFRKVGKPVLLYFCERPVIANSIDQGQLKRLVAFRTKVAKEGLVERYFDVAELRAKLSRHLTATIDRIQRTYTNQPASEPSPEDVQAAGWIRLLDQLDRFNRRFALEWSTERDSGVFDENVRQVLRTAGHNLLTFVSSVPREMEGTMKDTIQEFVRRLKSLERYRFQTGNNLEEFWRQGDQLVQDLDQFVSALAAGSTA